MVLSLSTATKTAFDTGNPEPIWLVEMHLGAFAYLEVLDYSAITTQAFSVDVVNEDASTATVTFTAGTTFTVGATNAATATNIVNAINASAINNRVSAFALDTMIVLHGYADQETRAQASQYASTVVFTINSADTARWNTTWSPIARIYRFISGSNPHPTVSGSRTDGVSSSTVTYAIPELREVTSVSASIDPMSREFSIGDIELVFDDQNGDSVIRQLIARSFPRGRFVKVLLGTTGLSYTNFLPVGGYLIDDVTPERGTIRISCVETPSVLRDRKFDNRGKPGAILTHVAAASLGTGVEVTIEVINPSGATTITFVEGGGGATGWTGGADQLSGLRSLSIAINAHTSINRSVHAMPNGDDDAITPFIFIRAIGSVGTTPVAFEDRPTKILARSSNAAVISAGEAWLDLASEPAGIAVVYSPAPNNSGCVHMHPIRLLRELYARAGLLTGLLNESTFDPASYSDIGHWGISATFSLINHFEYLGSVQSNYLDGMLSVDIQSRLCRMLGGGVVSDEYGVIRFERRDTGVASVRALTSDDFDEITQESQYENMVNRISVYGTAYGGEGNRVNIINARNETSFKLQSFNAGINPDELIIEEAFLGRYEHQTTWRTGVTAATTALPIESAWINALAGCRQTVSSDTSGAVTAGHGLSAGVRDGYIIAWRPRWGDFEIMKTTAAVRNVAVSQRQFGLLSPSDTAYRQQSYVVTDDYVPEFLTPIQAWDNWAVTVERAQKGTTAIDFTTSLPGDAIMVADATIALAMAAYYLDNFAFGVPVISFRTTLKHYDLQLTDVITITDSVSLSYLSDGLTSSTKWEIISKEIDFPFIQWKAARLTRANTIASGSSTFYEPSTEIVQPAQGNVVTDNDLIVVTDNDFNIVTI